MITNLVVAIITLSFAGNLIAQSGDPVMDDGITSPLHQANVGRITFMAKPIPMEKYGHSDFLTSIDLKEDSDLNIRVFMARSLTNYLHDLAPDLTPEELNKAGNYRFAFFVDGVLVYSENLNPGAGGSENKKLRTSFRIPLISTSNEDSWGRFLWGRFMASGGSDAIETGKHLLRIEIRPYIKADRVKVGELIAHGQLEIVITKPKVDENQIKVQPIEPRSGWTVSKKKVDQGKIRELNQKIAERTFKDITSIVVIQNGELLLEEYFNGANRRTLHDTRSVGKTFASTLTGIAIKDGYLKGVDQTLSNFYDLQTYKNFTQTKASVSIKDLLTMSSAFKGSDADSESPGNEENMYPAEDWVKFALNLPMDGAKSNGKQWDYFTAGVVIVGDILNRSVPQGLEKYADKKLFSPLGIKNHKWQFTPQKVPNTAGGLQMSSLDYARFGQLYRNGGTWRGKRIIPQSWVDASLTKHLEIPERQSEFYGYLFWNKTFTVNGKQHEAYYCSGNGGNAIYIFKNIPLVVVVTATAYNKPYGHPQIAKIMERYILPASVGQ